MITRTGVLGSSFSDKSGEGAGGGIASVGVGVGAGLFRAGTGVSSATFGSGGGLLSTVGATGIASVGVDVGAGSVGVGAGAASAIFGCGGGLLSTIGVTGVASVGVGAGAGSVGAGAGAAFATFGCGGGLFSSAGITGGTSIGVAGSIGAGVEAASTTFGCDGALLSIASSGIITSFGAGAGAGIVGAGGGSEAIAPGCNRDEGWGEMIVFGRDFKVANNWSSKESRTCRSCWVGFVSADDGSTSALGCHRMAVNPTAAGSTIPPAIHGQKRRPLRGSEETISASSDAALVFRSCSDFLKASRIKDMARQALGVVRKDRNGRLIDHVVKVDQG